MRNIKVERSCITTRETYLLHDGLITKLAFIDRPDKYIVCISSQVGCTGACKFCSAWQTKIVRNLEPNEMAHLALSPLPEYSCNYQKPVLISFMGTGEPMANIDNVLSTIKLLRRHGIERFAISTSGYNLKDIYKIPTDIKMQFSIISPWEDINKKYLPHAESLENIYNALDQYKGPKESNTTLIKGVNNNFNSITGLSYTLKIMRVHMKLNYFHAVNGLKPAGNEEDCLRWAQKTGVSVELYKTDGEDINAACGQFELNNA